MAGRLMLRREMGKIAFATLRDSSGADPAVRRGQPGPTTSPSSARLSLGDWIGATGEVVRTRTGELSVKISSWVAPRRSPAQLRRQVEGLTDVDLRYRQRYADLWAARRIPGHAPPAQPGGLLDPPLAGGTRLRRGGNPSLPSHPGRGRGQALCHPPQRPQHRPLPTDRPGVVPQAAGGRWHRTGVRDRPGVPQRGSVDPAQPRVHHARALPGLCRLHGHDGAGRGAGLGPGRGPARRPPS